MHENKKNCPRDGVRLWPPPPKSASEAYCDHNWWVDPSPAPKEILQECPNSPVVAAWMSDSSNSHWIIIESKLYVTVIQWRIQDLSEERRQFQKWERRANHKDGDANLFFLPVFIENCMKMK